MGIRGDTTKVYGHNCFMQKDTADTSRFYVDGTGFIDFCEKFKYLGSILHYSLTSDADVDKRIASATAAFGALKNILLCKRRLDGTLSVSYLIQSPLGGAQKNTFNSKYLSEELKGEVYKALVLPTFTLRLRSLVLAGRFIQAPSKFP